MFFPNIIISINTVNIKYDNAQIAAESVPSKNN